MPSTFETNRNVMERSAVVAERFVAITGPRSEPPMPMLTTFLMRFPVMSLPRAAADAVGETGHLVEHGVHVWNDVLPVHDDRGVPRGAEGDVEDRPFRDVDLLSAEHRVDPFAQP